MITNYFLLREKIDAIDAAILDLLNQRARVAEEVGHVKAETNAPVFRPEREAQVLRNMAEKNTGPLHTDAIQPDFPRDYVGVPRIGASWVVAFWPGGYLQRTSCLQTIWSCH